MNKNNLELFIDRVLHFPLWVKQAVYFKLANDFGCAEIPCDFGCFVPTLTFKGQGELKDKKCGFDSNIYNFLNLCQEGFSLLEISMNTFFSMEETTKLLEFCIEQEFINIPEKNIYAFVKFISGKYRIGEYLSEIGLISKEQLETVLQKNSGEKFGEKLCELGYVKENYIKQLFILKDEAQKRFVSDYNSIPNISASFSEESKRYEKEIQDLKRENELLKKKMKQLLQLVKNND